MFSQYEPNVKATISFLKLLNIKVTNTTVDETLQKHPDWPSLLCITDSLHRWNIPNGAGKINKENIDDLPTPFVAYTNNREFPLAIITDISATTIKQTINGYKKEETISRDNFLKNWDGVYLLAEPNNQSGEKNYQDSRKKEIIKAAIPVAAILLLAALSTIAILKNLAGVHLRPFAVIIQYSIFLCGVFITSLLVWHEIDKNNPLLQKVCTGIAKGNCNAILTGKQAKVFSWLSWSEVGFFYFTGALLLLLINNQNIISIFILVGWLNLLALPYTVFSVYYQWKVAKQWCVLCLAVQVLLLIGSITAIESNVLFSLPQLSFLQIANSLLLFVLPVLIWFATKPHLLILQQAKTTRHEHFRIKFSAEIFEMLLKKQKSIVVSPEGLGIDIGNPAAANTIIKVCNPYCGPCADAHPKIEALIEANNNIKAKIIFTTPNDDTHPAILPVRHLLAVAERQNEAKTKQALGDWYLAEKKDYSVFKHKYPMNGELSKQGNKIEMMDKWCKQTDIAFTPTIFINGQQLPDAYSIEDLEDFLLE